MAKSFIFAGLFLFLVHSVHGDDPCGVYSSYSDDPVLEVIVSLAGMATQSYQEKRCRMDQQALIRYGSHDESYLSSRELDISYRKKSDYVTYQKNREADYSSSSLAFDVLSDSNKPVMEDAIETAEGFNSAGVLSN